jgi:hypothetical protein
VTTNPPTPRVLGRRPRRTAAFALAITLATSLAATFAGAPADARTTTTAIKSGTYEGPCATDATATFATWRNKPVTTVLDGLDPTRWDWLDQPQWLTQCWSGQHTSLILAVPMIVTSSDTLAAGAAGAYDGYFRTLAQNLVAGGRSGAGLRLGWEFNGSWYKWSAAKDPAAFAAYFRRIVTVMRSVTGAQFSFIWNPMIGTQALAAEKAWPGDDVVDNVGLDLYDASWLSGTYPYSSNTATARTKAQNLAWQGYQSGDHGLDFWASFAAAHHKHLGFPEWGLVSRSDGHGGGDDPVFVQHVRDWVNTHDVTYEMYFDAVGALGEHRLRSGSFPNAAKTYQQLFGTR